VKIPFAVLVVLAALAPVHATMSAAGALVVIPVRWLVAAAVVLALAALALWVLRSILRDRGLRLRPGPAGT
jgi:hypothetical protein